MPPAGRLRMVRGDRILTADSEMSWERDHTRRRVDAVWSIYTL